MIETEHARPAPLSRVWYGSRVIAEDLTGDDLSDVMQLHAEASAWWVIDRSSEAASLHDLAAVLDLDKLAVADLLAADERAKYEELGQSRLVLSNLAVLDRAEARLTVAPLSMLVTDRALICVAGPELSPPPARLLAAHADDLGSGGVDAGLRVLITEVVNGYDRVVQWLEAESDTLVDALFEERPLSRTEQLRAYRLRKVLGQLRRLTEPMRTVIADLAEAADDDVPPGRHLTNRRAWTMINEQHMVVAAAADALEVSLSSTLDTSLALANTRMSEAMKTLTGWAAIIAVPTLVTGFVGMNVVFPLEGTVAGFWLYLAIMVVVGLVLFVVFRRKEWI